MAFWKRSQRTITRTIKQRCPVCKGRQQLPPGANGGLPQQCRACGGTGMVNATETVHEEESSR